MTRSAMVLLLAGMTAAAADPRDEYERRASQVSFWDARAHYEMALWCERKGLSKQAARHHRSVLEREPDHRASRRALGYRKVDGSWVRSKAKDAVATALVRLKNEDIQARRRAVRALGVLLDEAAGPRLLPPLYRVALEDTDEAVRHEAVRVLRSAKARGKLRPFVAALRSPSAARRLHAIDALGRMGDPAAIAPLLKRYRVSGGSDAGGVITFARQRSFLEDYDVEVG